MSTAISPAERAFALSPDPAKPNLPFGVVWKLCTYMDGTPYLKASCSHCSQTCDFDNIANLDRVIFKHCNVTTENSGAVLRDPESLTDNSLIGESRPTKEMLAKLVELQIRCGQRRRPNLIERVTGATPEMAKAF